MTMTWRDDGRSWHSKPKLASPCGLFDTTAGIYSLLVLLRSAHGACTRLQDGWAARRTASHVLENIGGGDASCTLRLPTHVVPMSVGRAHSYGDGDVNVERKEATATMYASADILGGGDGRCSHGVVDVGGFGPKEEGAKAVPVDSNVAFVSGAEPVSAGCFTSSCDHRGQEKISGDLCDSDGSVDVSAWSNGGGGETDGIPAPDGTRIPAGAVSSAVIGGHGCEDSAGVALAAAAAAAAAAAMSATAPSIRQQATSFRARRPGPTGRCSGAGIDSAAQPSPPGNTAAGHCPKRRGAHQLVGPRHSRRCLANDRATAATVRIGIAPQLYRPFFAPLLQSPPLALQPAQLQQTEPVPTPRSLAGAEAPAEASEVPRSTEAAVAAAGAEDGIAGEGSRWDGWWWELASSPPPLGSLDETELCAWGLASGPGPATARAAGGGGGGAA